MSQCMDTCALPQTDLHSAGVDAAAIALAGLLIDTPEMKDYTQILRVVKIDVQVSELLAAIYELQMDYSTSPDELAALTAQLEGLPQVIALRRAERAIQALFGALDEAVGAAAGLPFAANARSACG